VAAEQEEAARQIRRAAGALAGLAGRRAGPGSARAASLARRPGVFLARRLQNNIWLRRGVWARSDGRSELLIALAPVEDTSGGSLHCCGFCGEKSGTQLNILYKL